MKPSELIRDMARAHRRIDALEARLHVLERRRIEAAPSGDRDQGRVVLAVADTLGVSPAAIMAKGRSARIAWARQVSLWICHDELGRSGKDVARHFACDHTNVYYACQKVVERLTMSSRDEREANECRTAAKQKLATRPVAGAQ
jgi:chromosomal replication initiation ATPase DnaA